MYWYNQDIEWLEKLPVVKTQNKKIVFLGSSTFTRWGSITKDFKEFQAVNLGFGGSTLAACTWFFDRVVPRHNPDALIIYAGDNDLGDGRTPEEVVIFFLYLQTKIRKQLGQIPVIFISIKLSPSRKHLRGSIEYTNNCIAKHIIETGDNFHFLDIYHKMLNEKGEILTDLYNPDGLHLSPDGYALWKKEISRMYSSLF